MVYGRLQEEPHIESPIVATAQGLYCPAGDFHIDPPGPVACAVLTHAHGDHAHPGAALYYAATTGLPILRRRLGDTANLIGLAYGEAIRFREAMVSLHPAGHILGSAQVRIETDAGVCVVSGDYKRAPDPTCLPFELKRCDTFVTESTFSLPVYRWPATATVIDDLHGWWMVNRDAGLASVLTCYALGKAQRVLAELLRVTNETVYVHGAIAPLVALYREAGISMVPTAEVDLDRKARVDYRGALILAPPGAIATPWMKRFNPALTGFCSGWMRVRGQRRRRGFDRGFVLSDHADWPALLETIAATGAKQVLATHGHPEALVRYLREAGYSADTLATDYGSQE